MKKLVGLAILACFLLTGCAPAVLAETAQIANQEVDIDAAGAVALFLKQPSAQENVQVVKIHRSGLVLLITVAGKVPAPVQSESK